MIAIIQIPCRVEISSMASIYNAETNDELFFPEVFEITHEVQPNGRYFNVYIVPMDSSRNRFDTITFTADYKTLCEIYAEPRSFIISAFDKYEDDIGRYCYENHRTYTVDDLPDGISMSMFCVPSGTEADTYFYHEDDKKFTDDEISIIEKYMDGHPYKLVTKAEFNDIASKLEESEK